MEAGRKVGSEQEWGPVHLAQVSRTRLLELPYGDGVPWGLAVETRVCRATQGALINNL